MSGVFVLAMLILSGVIGIVGLIALIIKRSTNKDTEASAWIFGISATLAVMFGVILTCMSFKQIDAGEVAVQTRFGRVLEQTLTEGFNKKSPFVSVHTYDVRFNEYTMSSMTDEGANQGNDTIQARTRDDLLVGVDVTLRWSVDPQKASIVYRQVSPNMKGIVDIVVRPSSRSIIRDSIPQYSLNELNQNRRLVAQQIFDDLSAEFAKNGLILDSVFIRDIHPPREIDQAIQAKLTREQELQEQEFKRQIAEQQAEIRRIEAQGIADAQNIIQQDLTPIYVQYEAIQAYRELADSNNTTFVILPTDPNGAGMPIILGQ